MADVSLDFVRKRATLFAQMAAGALSDKIENRRCARQYAAIAVCATILRFAKTAPKPIFLLPFIPNSHLVDQTARAQKWKAGLTRYPR